MLRHRRLALPLAVLLLTASAPPRVPELSEQVEIRRTAYGVPHILAESYRAAGYALGWVQLEDHGDRVPLGLIRARGEMARRTGPEDVDADAANRLRWLRAVDTYPLLDRETREMYEGFAAGVNRFIELHPDRFPTLRPEFTGHDVHAHGVERLDARPSERLLERLDRAAQPDASSRTRPDVGSNAWAIAPSRTESGNAILLRNPHLSWDAGYYEAHVTIPGELNFYGDFRIGGPLGIIGGFNDRLGWATTNNDVDTDEIYALDVDPDRSDHYLFDGGSVPLRRESVTVHFRNGPGLGTATREFWFTPLGPVLHREHGKIYVQRSTTAGEYRAGMQFLRMMRADDLGEWKDAMRLRGRGSSNFTYADADGNIFYVWNGSLPLLPHPSGGDTAAIPARTTDQVWTRVLPWDSLPQLLNPRDGYLHNENDSFHYTSLAQPLDSARYPANAQPPELDLRSQLSLQILQRAGKVSLEDVVRLKHEPRMLLADRVKDDLLAAVRAASPSPTVLAAAELLERWDNTASADSRGSVLFESWWHRYVETAGTPGRKRETDPALFRRPWSPQHPTTTPAGLADPARAADAFAWVVEEVTRRHGAWDVAWGDVYRVRHGGADLPVAGCPGELGCFRVLWFEEDPDGKFRVRGGDGWMLAVEFGRTPRAYSVLAYGQSAEPGSPHHDDQAALFAGSRMKPVAFTEADIRRSLVRRYRPGAAGAGPSEAAVSRR